MNSLQVLQLLRGSSFYYEISISSINVVFVYFLEKIVKKKVPPTGVEPVTFACRYTSATLYH